MEETRSNQAEINSIAYFDKKRKMRDEPLEIPSPKHVCRDQHQGHSSFLDSNTEAKKVEKNEFARGGESEPESTSSNSFYSNSDTIIFTDDETKTDLEYPNTCSSDSPSTSSASSAGTSSEASLYSSKCRSSTNPISSEPESLSINEQPDCHLDFSFSEYEKGDIDQFMGKELEDLLCSNGVAPSSNYILSSGRWSVNQDAQQKSKKLTIDKEFEQYFSMLML